VAAGASPRLEWAVERLDVAPDDHVLEVGCGHGVAISLICDRLDGGTITAIDRSPKMIEVATRRNRDCIAAGKADVRVASVEDAELGEARFDKALAVHVRAVWDRPEALDAVRRALKPKGTLYLVNQPPGRPSAEQTERFTDEVGGVLRRHGLSVERVVSGDPDLPGAVCMIATA
jgi:ubiquinone/menaquinone biosynthesis C-methylase UbiE